MKRTILLPLLFTLFIAQSFSQDIDTLIFCDYKIIPLHYQYKETSVEEISGIEYAGVPGKYFLLPQTDYAPHYFLCTIEEHNKQLTCFFDSIITINAKDFDGESIRLNRKTNELFLSEELKKQSLIKKIDSEGNIKTILKSDSLQKYNRGWEGMCFNPNFTDLFISAERTYDSKNTHILRYNLKSHDIDTLSYQLDLLPNDTRLDNGITEILCVNDTTLLVLERAWQKSIKHTSVRVYKVEINFTTKEAKKTKLLFNFDNLYFNTDNVEGMTFNSDRTKLLFVTDDNKNKHQETQIICFKII